MSSSRFDNNVSYDENYDITDDSNVEYMQNRAAVKATLSLPGPQDSFMQCFISRKKDAGLFGKPGKRRYDLCSRDGASMAWVQGQGGATETSYVINDEMASV